MVSLISISRELPIAFRQYGSSLFPAKEYYSGAPGTGTEFGALVHLGREIGIVTGHKYDLTFVLSTTLTAGAGTEQFVLNVVKNAPLDKFNISIVQTDWQDTSRLDSRYVNDILDRTNVYTIRSFRNYLRAFDGASTYPALALKTLVTTMFNGIYRSLNGSTLDKIRGSDLIYLIRNDDLPCLKIDSSVVVLGSTHCSTLTFSSHRQGLGMLRRLFRVLKYRRIEGFHFTSAKWQKEAVVHKKYDFLLPLGTDTELYHPREGTESSNGKVKFLFVSRLEVDKGVTRLLDAWKLARLENAELHLAGTGSLMGLVKTAADEKRVIYHGVLSNEDLAALYRTCDAFVFPTQGEIYGLVVLEALASGLFAIVSRDLRGNFDEFERMGMLEYVCNEPRTISQSMVRISSQLEQVRRNRQRVFEYIRANHDWHPLSASLFSAFERILEQVS